MAPRNRSNLEQAAGLGELQSPPAGPTGRYRSQAAPQFREQPKLKDISGADPGPLTAAVSYSPMPASQG